MKDRPCLGTSALTNFLVLTIPVLPGILGYVLADLLGGGTLWRGFFPVTAGLVSLLGAFPITSRIVEAIRGQEESSDPG